MKELAINQRGKENKGKRITRKKKKTGEFENMVYIKKKI